MSKPRLFAIAFTANRDCDLFGRQFRAGDTVKLYYQRGLDMTDVVQWLVQFAEMEGEWDLADDEPIKQLKLCSWRGYQGVVLENSLWTTTPPGVFTV
jgi:hypothetical protein